MRDQEKLLEKRIEELVKDYKLCYPCDMFTGYEVDGLMFCKGCATGNDCLTCGISTAAAKMLVKDGWINCKGKVVLSQEGYDALISVKNEMKYYKIYGYDSNFDLGGSHDQPLLCIVRAKNKAQAEEYANTLDRYKNSWCGKGYIEEVSVKEL